MLLFNLKITKLNTSVQLFTTVILVIRVSYKIAVYSPRIHIYTYYMIGIQFYIDDILKPWSWEIDCT